jgi:Ca2+-binding RTX toxin-like protein
MWLTICNDIEPVNSACRRGAGNGGSGNDGLFGGQNSDLLNGGPSDDLLVGDIPNNESADGLPPTVDPTPHFDTCIGAGGTDQALTCERAIAI